MHLKRRIIPLLLVASLSVLAACDSAKERAEKHLQSAISLLQKGDVDRAIVEFRNVFKLDPTNREARVAFAKLMEKQGNLPQALAQYVGVIEQHPDDLEALKAASRLAATINDWPETRTRVTAALALAPKDPMLLGIKAAADYADAVKSGDDDARHAAAKTVAQLLATQPDNLLLQRVTIDNLIRDRDWSRAEDAIDTAITLAPKDKSFYRLRLSVLAALKDNAAIEQQLIRMVALFPDDPAMSATLLRWYVSHGDLDKAESYLRQAAAAGGDDLKAQLGLVTFLARYRGADVALHELDRILATAPDAPPADATADSDRATGDTATSDRATDDTTPAGPVVTRSTLRAMRASILFDQGKRDEGIKEMRAVLKDAAPSDETRRIKVTLARMLATTGNPVGARALVEEVLAKDKGQADALKLKARWLIESDDTDGAIALLRSAIDANPHDAQAMTLMAQAYQRAGNTSLMGDMLSQAVEASNKAPEESIRYAAFLASSGKNIPAESVLLDALRLDDTNVHLLAPLGQLYVRMKDWPRATSVADRLERIGTPEALTVSHGLRPAILAGQQKTDEAISYLKGLAKDGEGGVATQVAVIRSYLADGKVGQAQSYVKDLLAAQPDNASLRFISAAVQAAAGDIDGARATFSDLVKQDPTRLSAWVALIRLEAGTGKAAEARATLDKALTALPKSGDLLLMKAGNLEHDGDIDGAIAIYETLYKANSDNLIVANNLASLLASYRSDSASLDRAYVIARRLRGTTTPATADTYGWITYLRGNPQEALDYLERAAKGLPKNPLVQFHLAEIYRALKRPGDARAQYAKVLALVPASDTRAFVQTARKFAASLSAPDASTPDAPTPETGPAATQGN